MVKLELYRQFYDVSSIEDLVKLFQKGLVVTNRTPDFFVDWKKVKRHVDDIKIELSLWNSLIGSSDIESDFIHLINAYPEVIKTIPILAAIRDREFPVIIDFFDIAKGIKELDFKKDRNFIITESETRDYVSFSKSAGIFLLFDYIKNFYDYVLGVEVGMDTHARKNRSGKAMELLLEPIVEEAAGRLGCEVLFQDSFRSVAPWGKPPSSLANRTADFIIYSNTKLVNIEVNYYSTAGSKPEEIVNSYINRHNELVSNGWGFIWVTDGNVWRGSESQLMNAFNELDYVLNIDLVRRGMLFEALKQILQ